MTENRDRLKEQVLRTSGVNPLKCMRCGKCSGTCPSYDEMEYHPHQFVYMVEKGEIEKLMQSKINLQMPFLLCVRGALSEKRRTGQACGSDPPDGDPPAGREPSSRRNQVPGMLDEDLPQQAVVSAYRKYSK